MFHEPEYQGHPVLGGARRDVARQPNTLQMDTLFKPLPLIPTVFYNCDTSG